MQAIGKAVGEAQTNDASDVALIQAALVKIARPAAKGRPAGPYLSSYSGTFGKDTAEAITAFQTDHKLSGGQVTGGRVDPGDCTFQAMAGALPHDVADLRVLPHAKIVYLGATQAEFTNRLTEAASKAFTASFGLKVSATIRRMFTETGIVLAVDPDGDHRTFQKQYALRTSGRGVTHAGPGESNDNFGGGVDLGFKGLRWLKPDGTVVTEAAWWLAGMPAANQTAFWDKLRSTGIACGAFHGPLTDRPHLQNWDDAGVSMVSRLAVLLTRSGSMKWSAAHGVYHSDLGFGGALVPVGTSVQIWEGNATIDAATIRSLRTAHQAHGAAPRGPAPRPGPAPPGPAPHQPPAPDNRPAGDQAAEVAAMRQALRHQFDLAEALAGLDGAVAHGFDPFAHRTASRGVSRRAWGDRPKHGQPRATSVGWEVLCGATFRHKPTRERVDTFASRQANMSTGWPCGSLAGSPLSAPVDNDGGIACPRPAPLRPLSAVSVLRRGEAALRPRHLVAAFRPDTQTSAFATNPIARVWQRAFAS